MRIEMLAMSAQGAQLGARLAERLRADGDEAHLARSGENGAACMRWTAEHFGEADALIYIGAAAIAVRAIAPRLRGKSVDPAVIAVDARGRFAVPLLSGHIGGANRLAVRVAAYSGAQAVITTATDGAGLIAIDEWAAVNGLFIANPAAIVTVSSKLLRGEQPVYLQTDCPIAGPLPQGFALGDESPDVVVDCRSAAPEGALHLVPPALTLGLGCRKNTPAEQIEAAFSALMAQNGLHPAAVGRVASIDLKSNEPGLLAFCERRGLPLSTYSAERLAALSGDFAASAFVQRAVGVGNVCERSAAAEGAVPTVPKTVLEGVALALARRAFTLSFEENAAPSEAAQPINGRGVEKHV